VNTNADTPPQAEPIPAQRGLVRAAILEGFRIALFRPVDSRALYPSIAVLLALVLLQFALSLAFALARVGLHGQLNLYEVPRALFLLPLALFCGLACAEAGRDARLTLRVAIAASALSIVISIPSGLLGVAFAYEWLPIEQAELGWEIWYTLLFWWAAALMVAIGGLIRVGWLARARAAFYGLVLLVAPVYWIPHGELWSKAYDAAQSADPAGGLFAESVFYAQPDLLTQTLDALAPERPGIDDVYVLAAALYAAEDVFMKETGVIADLLERRFDAAGRTVRLVNNRATLAELPVASLTSIRRALTSIGERMNAQEDVLVMYLTSHGSDKHRLSVNLSPLMLDAIDPHLLRAALDDAGIRWRVIIVSACYSGGYVEPLKDERTLIITAASATKQSFGCGAASDFTYLAKALFDEALRKTHSFETAF
jgi:hypothetical protein